MKIVTGLFATLFAMSASAALAEGVTVKIVRNGQTLFDGALRIDVATGEVQHENVIANPYMLCSGTTVSSSASRATARDGATVVATRTEGKPIRLDVTIETVDEPALKQAQAKCATIPVPVQVVRQHLEVPATGNGLKVDLPGAIEVTAERF